MGTLNEDLSAIKAVEDTIIANKVAKFAYTDEAYNKNYANGVTEYNVNNAQNIPTADPSVLKVNDTVLSKGYRAQASSITRMLMNHFLGRLSYNVNKVNDGFSNLVATLIKHRGTANGFATLDENGRIPFSQLPESAMEYKGQWNAETNTPTLANGTGTKGDFYIVSVAGTHNFGSGDIQFFVNDRVIYDGSVWSRLSAGDVKTVNNISPVNGNIPLTGENIPVSSTDPTLLSAPLTTDRYADSSVTEEKLADNAVTNAKIKDSISVTKGGTGATDAKKGFMNLANGLAQSQNPQDAEYMICKSSGNWGLYTLLQFWEYIKGKISSVLGLTASNYNGTSAKATADGSGNNIENSYALKKGGLSDFQSNTHYFKSLGGWQNEDYVVIPILEITSSFAVNRYSNGKIFSQRNNGLYKNPYFEWYCNKQYSPTASEKYLLSVNGMSIYEVVTFNYNSKKYLGIAFKQTSPQCHETYFDGYAYPMEEPLFTIIRYKNRASGIINQEVNDSLTEITNYSYSGFADTATKLATTRTINIQDASATNTGTGASFDGSENATIKLPSTIKANITGNCSGSSGSCTGNSATATTATNATDAYNAYRGTVHTCTTANNIASKTVSVTGFTLTTGACIRVLFENGNNIANPTLNVNNTGAKEIRVNVGGTIKPLSKYYGTTKSGAYYWKQNVILELYYTGEYWVVMNDTIVAEFTNSDWEHEELYISGRKKQWGYLQHATSETTVTFAYTYEDSKSYSLVTGAYKTTNDNNFGGILVKEKTSVSFKYTTAWAEGTDKNISGYYIAEGF